MHNMNIFLVGDPHLRQVALQSQLLPGKHIQLVEREQLGDRLASCDPAAVVVLLLLASFDAEELLSMDLLCERYGVGWVSCHFEWGVGWLGPVIDGASAIRYRDVLLRRVCAAPNLELHHALSSPPRTAYLPTTPELVWILALLCIELRQWRMGHACRLVNAELMVNPLTGEIRDYPLLPMPDRGVLSGSSPCEVYDDMTALVNERTGIVLNLIPVTHHLSIPQSLTTMQAYLPQMQRYDPTWYNVTTSLGSGFESPLTARMSAIGEAVERYCMNYFVPQQIITSSYQELSGRGEYAIDPETLVLFSDAIYETRGCPFTRFTQTTECFWRRGYSLTHRRPAWLPLPLVHTHWQVPPFDAQPLFCDTFYPGVAAGRTLEQALVAGIEEVIERDSMMVWWMNRQPLPSLRLPPKLLDLWSGLPIEKGQRAWSMAIPNEFGIPVVAGVVEQTYEQLLNIGFACRHDPSAAILKAWAEALTLQERSRDLNRSDSLLRVELANDASSVLKPWRADRQYRDSYQPNFRDMTHTVCAEQFYLDPRAIEAVRSWVDLPPTQLIEDVPLLADRSLATYQERVEARGYEIFYCDLTTPDLRMAGWHVVRVIIPGLMPEFPAAFPHTGRERAQRAAVQLGWRNAPLDEDELNYLPIPYA